MADFNLNWKNVIQKKIAHLDMQKILKTPSISNQYVHINFFTTSKQYYI